jgi:hypothetical protein
VEGAAGWQAVKKIENKIQNEARRALWSEEGWDWVMVVH